MVALLTAPFFASGQRSGGDNSIDAEVMDAGGGVATSGAVTLVGSIGSVFGTSSAALPPPASETLHLWGGFVGQLSLSTLYADDGIDDDWQELYFGFNNPDGQAGENPDGDWMTNLDEFVAGTDPTDPGSHFAARIEIDDADPDRVRILFSPYLPDRTYTLTSSSQLEDGSFADLPATAGGTPGVEGRFLDTAAADHRFYRVRVEKN